MTAPVPAALRLALILGCLAHPARGETPGVRLGSLDLKPYVLLQLDEGGTFDQSRGGGQATGFNVRRARVGGQGTYGDEFEFGLIWDSGGTPGNHSRLFEADIAYTGFAPFFVRAGVFKPAFTLEYAQSAADTLFLERASIVNVVGGLVAGPGRVGAQLGASGERWYATALLTGGRTGPGARSDQRAVLGRAAGLVVKTDDVALHLGLSGGWLYQAPRSGAGGRSLSFSDQSEVQIDRTSPSLATGSVAAKGARIGGVELGLGWGRLWAQAEWYGIGIDRTQGRGNPFFSGWYAQAAYTLAGTPRRWSSKIAGWGSPVPDAAFHPSAGGWGALELAARYSTVNLESAGIEGGQQRVWTVGLNWFPVQPLRLALEFEHAAITGGKAPRDLNAVAVRGQLRF